VKAKLMTPKEFKSWKDNLLAAVESLGSWLEQLNFQMMGIKEARELFTDASNCVHLTPGDNKTSTHMVDYRSRLESTQKLVQFPDFETGVVNILNDGQGIMVQDEIDACECLWKSNLTHFYDPADQATLSEDVLQANAPSKHTRWAKVVTQQAIKAHLLPKLQFDCRMVAGQESMVLYQAQQIGRLKEIELI
jgi:hypothetical protein